MSFLSIPKFKLNFDQFFKKLVFSLLIALVLVCNSLSSSAQDQKIADSLIAVDRKVLPDSIQLHILREIAFNHTNPDVMLLYADSLLYLARSKKNLSYINKAYFQKGNAYRLKGDLSLASEYYFKSVKISTKLKLKNSIGAAYIALGDVYSLNNDHENSKAYYYKAINIYRESKDSVNLASALTNLGDEYFNVGKLDSALHFFDESYLIFTNVNYRVGQGYCLGNLGLVYATQNKHELAEQYLEDAISILKELGEFYPIAVYFTYMADIYRDKNDLKRALKYAQKSLDISLERGFKEQIKDAYLKLSELYGAEGQFDKAYEYQNQYIAYKDSINNEATTKKIADLRTAFEVSQKQAEIDLLMEKDRNYQIIAGSLVLVVILFGILAYQLYRNNRRKLFINKKLTLQKDALKTHRDELQTLNQTKDRFFSIISHDLRGPVNAFNGISTLIKYYVESKDMEQLVEVTEYIDKSASQLSTLLDTLLDWAISQQGSFPYYPEKVLFNNLTEETYEIFQTAAHSKKIQFCLEVQSNMWLWADRNTLSTIIRNLINNALKFTKPEGSVTLKAFKMEEYGVIEVIDTGIGIPCEKLLSIFELIEKKNTQGTAGEKGLGLGLQLAYDFTKMNNGSIDVKSEEGVGTTFTVKIPLYKDQDLNSSNFKNHVQIADN